MTARSPHFECGASTSFATRPYIQLHYYTLFTNFATTIFKINSQSFAVMNSLMIIDAISGSSFFSQLASMCKLGKILCLRCLSLPTLGGFAEYRLNACKL